MCGFFGAFSRDGVTIQRSSIELIEENLVRRGPDQSGEFQNESLYLLHKRLSIIDLDERSSQPMIIEINNQKVIIVFNGECYNYLELKNELQLLGHEFKTTSDTEVILMAYIEWGLDFTSKLNGAFSLGIYDQRLNKIFLVRDRLGIKPLYYKVEEGLLYFSSDIKSILDSTKNNIIDKEILNTILKFRYNPIDQSLYKSIHKLAPGHILEFDESVRIKKYWSLGDIRRAPQNLSYKDSCDEFFQLLDDSVKLRLRSDADIGVFLSGGIDSTALAAIARPHYKDLKSFTINVGGGLSEGSAAKEISDKLGIENFQFLIKPDDYHLTKKVLSYFDEPILDSILVPTYLLSKAAAKQVKVVLSGEGADEIFGGYVHHKVMIYANFLNRIFPFISSPQVIKLASHIPLIFWNSFFNYPSKLGKKEVNKFLNFLNYQNNPVKAYTKLVELFSSEELSEDLLHESSVVKDLYSRWNKMSEKSFTHSLLKYDLRTWGANYTLARLDTLTMANSLEARVPYLDHRIVEFVLKQPANYLSGHRKQKRMLRDAVGQNILKDKLNKIVSRKKQPFFINTIKSYDKDYAAKKNSLASLKKYYPSISLPKDKASILDLKKSDAYFMLSEWLELKSELLPK